MRLDPFSTNINLHFSPPLTAPPAASNMGPYAKTMFLLLLIVYLDPFIGEQKFQCIQSQVNFQTLLKVINKVLLHSAGRVKGLEYGATSANSATIEVTLTARI